MSHLEPPVFVVELCFNRLTDLDAVFAISKGKDELRFLMENQPIGKAFSLSFPAFHDKVLVERWREHENVDESSWFSDCA